MLQQPEKLDISFMVDYRRRLGRASLAGTIYGAIVFSGFASAAFYRGDRSQGGLWVVTGIVILGLSLLLRKGFLVAAVALGPALILGTLLMWRGMAVSWEQMSWGKGAFSILFAVLVIGPIAYFLISGIEAVYTSRQVSFGEVFESAGSKPSSGIHQPNRTTREMYDWGNWRTTILQRISEVILLAGAGTMLASAVLSVLSNFRGGLLSLIGVALLILGVNLSLHVEQVARTQIHDLLTRNSSPTVLLLRPVEDDLLKIRARLTLSRPLVKSLPSFPFTQVIHEQAARFGVVVAVDEAEHIITAQIIKASLPQVEKWKMRSEQRWQSATAGKESGEMAEMIWQRKLDGWMRTSQVVVMILGKIECLDRERSHRAEQLLRRDAILVFPPVSFRQMKERWESFCRQFNGAVEQSLISGPELKRASLLVFREDEKPLLILSSSHDEWAYQTAFEIAADALRRQE